MSEDSLLIIDILGWAGAALVLLAYGLLSLRRVTGEDLSYHLLNLGGSICLAIYALYYKAHASVLVNVIWLGIALWAIAGLMRRRKA